MGVGLAAPARRRQDAAEPAARKRPETVAPQAPRGPPGRPVPATTRERMKAAFGLPPEHGPLADTEAERDAHERDAHEPAGPISEPFAPIDRDPVGVVSADAAW